MEPGKSTASDKHIVLVVPGFPKDEGDTQCLPFVHGFVQLLNARVRKVSVLALHYPYRKEKYKWHGIDVYPLDGRNSNWKRVFTLYRSLSRVVEHLNAQDSIDVLHAIWINDPGAFSLRLGKQFGLPVVLSAPGQDVQPGNRFLPQIRKSDQTVYCLSHYQTHFLMEAGFKRVQVIEWGTKRVDPLEKREFDLCCISSLIPLKNVGYFIHLIETLKARKQQVKAVVVGGGPQHAQLMDLIRDLNLSEEIHLLGEQGHEVALDVIARSKILVHASSYEGFGMVHIEALAAGCHVLSTPVGIALDNPRIHSLTLDPEEDAEFIVNLLKQEMPAPYLYDIETTVDRYLEVYDSF